MSSPPPLLCFRLAQLLAFYLGTVEGVLGAGSQLAEALRASRAMALRTFHEALRQRGAKLLRYPPPPPRDLTPPQQVRGGRQPWGLVGGPAMGCRAGPAGRPPCDLRPALLLSSSVAAG